MTLYTAARPDSLVVKRWHHFGLQNMLSMRYFIVEAAASVLLLCLRIGFITTRRRAFFLPCRLPSCVMHRCVRAQITIARVFTSFCSKMTRCHGSNARNVRKASPSIKREPITFSATRPTHSSALCVNGYLQQREPLSAIRYEISDNDPMC